MVHENNTENKVYQNKNTASESSVNCLPTANIYSIITFTYTLSETALEWVTDLQTTFNHLPITRIATPNLPDLENAV